MNWREYKKLIDLTAEIYFAKNKICRDRSWKEFEIAVDHACINNFYSLPSEKQTRLTAPTRARELYLKWVHFIYFRSPCRQFQVAVGYSINSTFGTEFCLENNTYGEIRNPTKLRITPLDEQNEAGLSKKIESPLQNFKNNSRQGQITFFKNKDNQTVLDPVENTPLLKRVNN
ncbi:MAG: hypothetical protein H0U57_12605 [Tatlockia sp.]|nr:hypothetical protein [Tatlockia sp.]